MRALVEVVKVVFVLGWLGGGWARVEYAVVTPLSCY